MKQIYAILLAKLRMARHAIASVRSESKLKVGVISICAFGLWVGVFLLFLNGFDWLLRFGADLGGAARGLGGIIMVRMLGVLSMVVFFMLVFSNVLVSFSTLYRSREVSYLLQAPVSYRSLFAARFVECVLFSSWALAFLGSPLILAYGLTSKFPVVFYLAAVAFFVPFVTLPAALGALITMLLVRVFPRVKVRTMVLLGILSVLVLFLYLRKSLGAARLSEETILPTLLDLTSQTQAIYLPSYWVSRGILAAAAGRYGECLFNLLFLCSNALMALWVCSNIAQGLFYPGWAALAGQERMRLKPLGRGVLGRLDRLLEVLPEPGRALIAKDIKLFWRDASQWSQFVVFFGVMGVYIANLRNTSSQYQQEFWRSWIACLNTGACTLILATLTSRFVFPLVSLEGRRFWIIGLAPLSFRQLVWQKFWLSVMTTSLFTVALAALSAWILQLEFVNFALTIYSVAITNFGLSGLAIGLGALYPNFQEDNPARIVSGMGGTLNFLLSVGYIALVIGAETIILQWHALQLFPSEQAFRVAVAAVVVFVTILSLASTLIPMRLGLRNLRLMEF